jgi:hypothetical protein
VGYVKKEGNELLIKPGFLSVCSHPAPTDGVPFWPSVSTETGPYLRIDRVSEVRDNFLEEYTIATTAGLGPSRATLLSASTPVLLVWLVMAVLRV